MFFRGAILLLCLLLAFGLFGKPFFVPLFALADLLHLAGNEFVARGIVGLLQSIAKGGELLAHALGLLFFGLRLANLTNRRLDAAVALAQQCFGLALGSGENLAARLGNLF